MDAIIGRRCGGGTLEVERWKEEKEGAADLGGKDQEN